MQALMQRFFRIMPQAGPASCNALDKAFVPWPAGVAWGCPQAQVSDTGLLVSHSPRLSSPPVAK
jgi:hypothetical protein